MTGKPAAKRTEISLALLLSAVILAIYFPVLHYDFLFFDDDAYVTDNTFIRDGLSLGFLRWAFSADYLGIWHPVTWISHAIDYRLFGDWPGGHHIVSAGLHLLNSVLLLGLLKRLTGRVGPSAFVAALFALHPLHVESVAWISERKDVLSATFLFLTIWTYAHYREKKTLAAYLWVVSCFALGLMAKPMLVTVPALLLLLDFWPLKHITHAKAIPRAVVEKLPLFALSAACAAITLRVQATGGALKTFDLFPLSDRIANALWATCAYLGKTVWPHDLAVFYPFVPGNVTVAMALFAAALLLGITGWVLYERARKPYLLVGWLWYLVTLLPVIGIVQVGAQSMADRYTYIPLIGIFIAFAWFVDDGMRTSQRRTRAAATVACALLVALAYVSSVQLDYWRNTRTLFAHSMQVTGPNPIAHAQLGYAFSAEERFDDAIAHFETVVVFQPDSAQARNDLAGAYAANGQWPEAAFQFEAACALAPDNPNVFVNLARVQAQQGNLDAAIDSVRQALNVDTEHLDATVLLAGFYTQQGNFEMAQQAYRDAIRLAPEMVALYVNLGNLLARAGQLEDATDEYERALALEPDHLGCLFNLGNARFQLGRYDEAKDVLQRAVTLDPDFAPARDLLRRIEEQSH
ncbi:MAG: tetratricopeptide repeat protein [Candidatus Hydrogenedentes bacterium]|nr:tetratricopeptide repeat protein [Candidatus Hydrogenedentota bacterium]